MRKNLSYILILKNQGKGFYVIPVGDQTYTGAAIKPAIQVYDSVFFFLMGIPN